MQLPVHKVISFQEPYAGLHLQTSINYANRDGRGALNLASQMSFPRPDTGIPERNEAYPSLESDPPPTREQIAVEVAKMGVDPDTGALWIDVIQHAWTTWMPLGPASAEDVSTYVVPNIRTHDH